MSTSDVGIVQLFVVYYPVGMEYPEPLWATVNEDFDCFWGFGKSQDECISSDWRKVTSPFLVWMKTGIAGYADGEMSLLEYEWDTMGKEMFDGAEEFIADIVMPHFKEHPDLRLHRGYGRSDAPRKTLDEIVEPMCISIPILWRVWIDVDTYTDEQESESYPVGEVNMWLVEKTMKEQLPDGGE